MSLLEKLRLDRIPQHVAIIMDGNGRWARKRGNDRSVGHERGLDAVRDVVEGACDVGIKYLTLYAFSTENWNRPKEEVQALMSLLVYAISNETENLNKNNVRLLTIGDTDSLPPEVQENLEQSKSRLSKNTGLDLVLALSYSSRWEILKAVKTIGSKIGDGSISSDSVTEETFTNYLNTSGIPDPELLIRTSGELRISNFLLWQIAYAELYFSPILWPDFRKEDLFEALYDFQQRERRFGKTSEQIQNENA
ncbi:MAG: isoprenyl transferase [Bacteroidota bacterium]|nr:isoprenyl transferase [Bacteroidota bacterium]MDP4206239.1 isoprenyl transferase [Bacteroidota bacterium]